MEQKESIGNQKFNFETKS